MNRLANVAAYCFRRSNARAKHEVKTIYMLKCGEFYKIGYARNFKERFYGYAVHNPHEVSIVKCFDTIDYSAFEEYVFKSYCDKHHRGEWFKLSDNDVQVIIDKWFTSNSMGN